MTLTRRRFLAGAAAAASSGYLVQRARAAPRALTTPRPTMLVQIVLRGGIDAMLFTDPKRKGELVPEFDIPYPESDIRMIGATRVGPLLAPLERFVSSMAIINGVVTSTVAHDTGLANIQEMRRVYPRSSGIGLTGSLGSVIRGDAPLSDVRIDLNNSLPRPPAPSPRTLYLRSVGERGMVKALHELAQKDLRRDTIRRALETAASSQGQGAALVPYQVVSELVARMAGLVLPAPDRIIPGAADNVTLSYQKDARQAADVWAGLWRDTLFLLQNRICPTVLIVPEGSEWDSHQWNTKYQTWSIGRFAPALAYFLDELERRRTSDGVLLKDQVGVVISSEIGRFPRENQYHGKDHFPELPVVLMGPGLRAGQYGQTDRRMISTAISVQTGRASGHPRAVVPTVDDIGATILHWFGVDDTRSLGYLGRRLDFLLD